MHRAKCSPLPCSRAALSFTRMVCVVFCLCCTLWPALASAQSAGRVISLTPGAFVERGGATQPLTLQSEVKAGDTLFTDAAGRARVLFADDSSMSLAPNTRLTLTEFVTEGAKPTFKARLGQGLARAITGKIVEANPAGFTLNTPEAVVGIRGTIISVRSERGVTTVYVENTLRNVYVNDVNVPGGLKLTVPSGQPTPQPITPQDRREIGKALAFAGRAGAASASPEPSEKAKEKEERGERRLVAGGLPIPGTQLAALPLDTMATGDTLASALGGSGGPMGRVGGAIFTANSGAPDFDTFGGSFSFDVDLQSGAISNATMVGTGLAGAAMTTQATLDLNLSNGSGTANATGFMISNFTDNGSQFNAGGVVGLANSELFNRGAIDLVAQPDGATIFVGYSIWDGGANVYDSGDGTGILSR